MISDTSIAASGFGIVTLLAGGAVGALLRVLVHRATPTQTSRAGYWVSELGIAAALSLALGIALAAAPNAGLLESSMGGALTAYAGASAALAFFDLRAKYGSAIAAAIGHFLACNAIFVILIACVSALARLV